MKNRLLGGLFASILLAAPLVVEAGPPPKPGPVGDLNTVASWTKTFIGYYEGTFPKFEIDDSLCNGQVPAEREAEATELLGRINSAITRTKSSFRRVSPADKSKPWVAERLAWRAYAEACAASIVNQRKAEQDAAAAQKAELKKRYWDFMGATKDLSRTIRELVGHVDGKTGGVAHTPDPAQLQKYRDDLEALNVLCTGPHKDVKNDPRYGHSSDRNPEIICQLAAKRDEVIKGMALAYADTGVKSMVEAFEEQLAELEEREGHLATLVGTIQKQALHTPDEMKKELGARYAPVLEVAGLSASGEMWAGFDAARSALWAKINELGPSWQSPEADGKDRNAEKAAKASFKTKGVKVKKAYVTRNEWNIVKNSLGIPLRRTKPGFIIYQVQVDKANAGKLCRARSFTYAEEYDGRRYKKSKAVTELGYVRFQSCK